MAVLKARRVIEGAQLFRDRFLNFLAGVTCATSPQARQRVIYLAAFVVDQPAAFGTDDQARDILSRIVYGSRITLWVVALVAVIATPLGLLVGTVAGYMGGWVDAVLMRITDAMLSIPRLPLLMIAAAILTPTVPWLIVLVGAAGWMETARVVRAEVQSIKANDFVTAARAVGATSSRVVLRHVLPGVLPTAAVATTLAVGRAILLESALSFFGVGVQPPTASWGNMLYQAQTTMSSEPWLGIFPGAFIFITVLCCNVLGTALTDRAAGVDRPA